MKPLVGMKRFARQFGLMFGVATVFGVGFAAGNLSQISQAQAQDQFSPELEEAFAPLQEIYDQIENYYIDDVDVEALFDGAASGMVEALDDPFSGYMSPETYELMNADLEGEIEGIGVVIRTIEDTGEIQVVGILNGAPAEAAGIQRGDIFAEVDGTPVAEISQTELAERVRGPEGTTVDIIMVRDGERVAFTITRARIVVPNVETRILDEDAADGGVAYIRLNQFAATAREELDEAFESVNVNERAGLIFDMRDNPGGLLNSAVDVASAFIEDGVILTEAFSDDDQRVFNATGDDANIIVPIIVLVNGGSASASELVAGALQDQDEATILGETTFGKGTVQTWLQLSNGGGLRLTVARWLTPDGNWIHENGVTPDVTVAWTPAPDEFLDENTIDPQMQAAIDLLRGADPESVEILPASTEEALEAE